MPWWGSLEAKYFLIFLGGVGGGANNVMSPASCPNLQHALAATLCNFSWNLQHALQLLLELAATLLLLRFATFLGTCCHALAAFYLAYILAVYLTFLAFYLVLQMLLPPHRNAWFLHTLPCKHPTTFIMDTSWIWMPLNGRKRRQMTSAIPCKGCFQHHVLK